MAALYLGLTDLFVAASGIVVILIVLFGTDLGRPIYWPADLRLSCPDQDSPVWTLATADAKPIAQFGEIEALFDHLPRDRLHVNLLVVSPASYLACLPRVRQAVDRYHRTLGQRGGKPGPIVASEWLPSDFLSAQ